MAFDETLAERVREALGARRGLSEKRMFGGVAFLLGGRMFCGIVKDELMVRVGPERDAEALRQPHVRPMDFTGRPMRGYVYVAREGLRTARALAGWVEWGAGFAATLPASAGKPAVAKRKPASKPAARRNLASTPATRRKPARTRKPA
jgi:TfoX/Sxy family transcriptional regulator of competence genes